MIFNRFYSLTRILSILLILLAGCSGKKAQEPADDAFHLRIDGSSTVYPLTVAISEKYKLENNDLIISNSVSGTGGGFEKFAEGKTQINNASREIKEEEIAACHENNVQFQPFEIAYDGIAIIVNHDNDWIEYITVEELNQIFGDNDVKNWSDVRQEWPDEPIKLFGPGEASGTYDYFKEAILEDKPFNPAFIKSENDNLLVRGISNNVNAIGFFGLAYFQENKDDLKLVPVDNGKGPITPNARTIASDDYTPLSRSMYVYVNKEFLDTESGKKYIRFYLENAAETAEEIGYVPLPESRYKKSMSNL